MSVEITDNTKKFIEAKNDAVIRALEAIGLQAEGYAKAKCPVDTGLLRNSITHTVSGESFSHTYHADYGSNRKSNGKRYSASSKNAGSVGFGRVSGTEESSAIKCAYVGTPVEYAEYVEYGTQRMPARPFIKPAAFEHVGEYKAIFEEELKKG